jgi:protein-disulfide isomerase
MKPSILVALIVGALVGFAVGHSTAPATAEGPQAPQQKSAQNNEANPADEPLFKVTLGDAPVRGNKDALVTVVEFSDFQCPFCGRANGTLEQLRKQYGDKLRVVMKQNPLDFHPHARPAALAALAAGKQGKFWEMYDVLFDHQRQLEQADLEKYAQQVGVNVDRWKADLKDPALSAQIDRDLAQGRALGVTGTPAFFINGRKIGGAQAIEKFRALIDAELTRAQAQVRSGTPASRVYEAVTAKGLTSAPSAQPTRQAPPAPVVRKVEIPESAVSFGPKHAKVTIVEFSDFQCPFCGRAAPAVEQIRKAYPKDVQFVFRHFPLGMHPNAHIAAQAAVAAQKQDKFWEMHDLLFAHQRELTQDKLFGYAKQLGLNMKKFEADFASAQTNAQISQDQKDGAAVGVTGTPYFFINGRQQVGAMPFAQWKGLIDAEIAKADKLLKSGVKTADLYDALVKQAKSEGPQAAAPTPAQAPGQVKQVAIGSAPVRGPANAPVTIVEFSDFQCPFCGRAANTLKSVEAQYKGKVKVVFKNEPLSIHPNARPAAIAALAARDQGKFWEMHDVLFANQRTLDRASLEKYAQDLHLDMAKFRAALDGNQYASYLQADQAQASQLGVRATPTFFVNGQQLVGPTPDQLRAAIDAELAKAHK